MQLGNHFTHYLQYTADCIKSLIVIAPTGSHKHAGFGAGDAHHIVLKLDDKELEGDLKGPVKKRQHFVKQLSLPFDFQAGTQCIKRSDIREVRLVAGDKNGWLIKSIQTIIVYVNGDKQFLTNTPTFNKWLETDKKKRRSYVLDIDDSDEIF
jgi:hypothetical protein